MKIAPQKAYVLLWKDVKRWMVPTNSETIYKLREGWELVHIGEVVQQVRERIIVEAEKEYKLVGVRLYGKGTFHRETVRGDSLSAVYLTPLVPNSLIYNRLFAWKQSFAVVPVEHEGCYVSSEFPQFVVDQSRLLPRFLYLFLMLKSTTEMVESLSVGSSAVSRNRFKEEEFLEFEIPLPPLSVQEIIVARWQIALKENKTIREHVEKLIGNIEEAVYKELGLLLTQQETLPKVFAVHWENMLRWSVGYNQQAQSGADLSKGKYPVVQLDSLAKLIQYGTSEKANIEGKGVAVVRMNNIYEGLLNLQNLKHIELSDAEKESLLLQDGDILFNRTNSKELVGKCAVFHEAGDYVFASYLIRIKADVNIADADYLSYVINSRLGRQQIDALSRQIIGQANINTEELRSLQIPLPPLEVQRAIMCHITEERAKIAHEREIAENQGREIEAEVEELILGIRKL